MRATNKLTHMTEDVTHQATKYTKDHLMREGYGYTVTKPCPYKTNKHAKQRRVCVLMEILAYSVVYLVYASVKTCQLFTTMML